MSATGIPAGTSSLKNYRLLLFSCFDANDGGGMTRQSANLYFLVIAILQSIKQISPLTPVTAIAPLVMVVSISLLRETIEDRVSRLSDALCLPSAASLTPLRTLIFTNRKSARPMARSTPNR